MPVPKQCPDQSSADCPDNTLLYSLATTQEQQDQDNEPFHAGTWGATAVPIIVDSATSRTITPIFTDLINPTPFDCHLKGIGNGRITHKGAIRWPVSDLNGKTVILEDRDAYFCRDSPYRLLCPHSWRRTQNARRNDSGDPSSDQATFFMPPNDGDPYILSWNRGRTVVECQLDPQVNLPRIEYASETYHHYCSFVKGFSPTTTPEPHVIPDDDDSFETMRMDIQKDPIDFNLVSDDEEDEISTSTHASQTASPKASHKAIHEPLLHAPKDNASTTKDNAPVTPEEEKLFMGWHVKLGHAPFRKIRWAAQMGILPKRLAKCRDFVCPACMYGKQHRRPWRVKGQKPAPIKKATAPGECVSIDQLISATPGLVAQTTGRLTRQRYKVATVFVDHYSDLDYVHVHETTSAEEAVQAKEAFENFAADKGVSIKHYHADNGIFASKGFRSAVALSGQTLSFCGVGAHHQNGICERRIQDLTQTARTALAYAAQRNPAVTAALWPYALRHASYVRRMLPKDGHSKSPDELFSRSSVRPTTRFLHVFGCPVYVLQGPLQSGGPFPKWKDRSRVGINLGHSAQHAASVSLILNPQTGFISPQFHCVYDDNFDSAKSDPNFNDEWARLAGLAEDAQASSSTLEGDNADYSNTMIPDSLRTPFTQHEIDTSLSQHRPEIADNANQDDTRSEGGAEPTEQTENEPPQPIDAAPTSRSGRRIKRTMRLQESPLLQQLQSFASIYSNIAEATINLDETALCLLVDNFSVFLSSFADTDTMYLQEAMRQPDRDKFVEAMMKEIEDHTVRGHWRITTRQEMKDRKYNLKPIAAIWSFKRKRNPMGEITKYKARLCCHGGQTVQGVHYHDTFSPVVSWTTIRLLLILSIINGWHARQIDFVLAFPQANVKTDVYMHVPEKFRVKNKKLKLDMHAPHPSKQDEVVKLIKNVYGLKDASKTWIDHLTKGLLEYGFTQSQVDPCLFMKGPMIFCVYVDDAICFVPEKQMADDLIEALKKKGYMLTDEGEISAYLGIQIRKLPDGRISLTQPALISRIIEQCGLKDERMHDTPADSILHRDKDGEPRKTSFHYRSIIGQLNYLAGTSRPEIQFAVHQCARFSQDPKMSHEKAIKRIVRYLKRTKDEGMILDIDKSKGFECYVDADFAGGYRKEDTSNPRDCLSRTGYVVKYAGCPLVWSSKLQSTIALSTSEAEYIALSTAMREVIYMINLTQELRENKIGLHEDAPTIKCRVFEDNAGAIELAKLPKLRPRTKHLAIQYHHFRSWTVRGLDGEDPKIQVLYVDTKEQQADIFTKPLPRVQFQYLRRKLIGW